MAKYFTPLWMTAISGFLDGAVFALKERILPVRGNAPSGWMRKFVYAVADTPINTNIKTAFALLASVWKAMTAGDQITWNSEASDRSATLGYDVTGRMLFFSYFMTKLAHGLSPHVKVATLGAGSGADYTNRATRQFTTAVT